MSVWYTVWAYHGGNSSMREKGWDEMQYITVPIQSNGQVERGEKNIIMTQLTRPFDTVAITKNAVHPERIIELLDYICTEEGQILLQSGIEGVHYTRDADGQRIATEEYIDGVKNVDDYWLLQGFGIANILGAAASTSPVDNQPYGIGSTESAIAGTRPDRINEAYAELGWETPLDWWLEHAVWQTVGVASGVSVDPQSDEGNLEALLADFRVKNSAVLIQASSDEEFESLYADLVEQYNAMGPEVVVDKYNELYAKSAAELEQYK